MKPSSNLVIDVIVLVIYLIAANPLITGLALHEWLSLGVVVAFIVHTATHLDWCIDAVRKSFSTPSFSTMGNLLLDSAALLAFIVVTVSGLMVSRFVLPLAGLSSSGYFFWYPLHAISAKVLLALLVVHVVVHIKWLILFIKGRKRKEKPDDEAKEQPDD
jgi:hypothetical protein